MPQILNLEPAGQDLSGLKRQVDRHEDEYQDHQRRTKILSVVLGVLIVSLIGILGAIYPILRDEKKGLADLFTVQNITNTLNERTTAVEGSLTKIKSDLPALLNLIDKVQANTKADLQSARNQMNRSIQAIQSRLSGLESNQKQSSERVDQLQEQVSRLQHEIAVLHDQASSAAAEKTAAEQNKEEPPVAPDTQD